MLLRGTDAELTSLSGEVRESSIVQCFTHGGGREKLCCLDRFTENVLSRQVVTTG